ncbi:hypothetical protein GHT06_021565 [Daphnia sinensis]|uniref:Uncharacterized protein n=1 Tax=Daphnia sinensis TaxID=1820382 RepID=A0AAD5L1Q0_9CRUS|nr:hypothetical protein GHT06_021565 [Daphnia sinensis]
MIASRLGSMHTANAISVLKDTNGFNKVKAKFLRLLIGIGKLKLLKFCFGVFDINSLRRCFFDKTTH